MGILFEKVKFVEDSKRNFLIEKLLAHGVTTSLDGTSIDKLDYYQLRHTLAVTELKLG